VHRTGVNRFACGWRLVVLRGGGRRLSLAQELFLAMLAAKVKRLSVAFSMERRRFVNCHSAYGVFSHRDQPFSNIQSINQGVPW
jgi:hypothetical protein